MQDYLQNPICVGDTVLTISDRTNSFYTTTVVELGADTVVVQATPTCPRIIKNNTNILVTTTPLAVTTQKYPEHYL